MNSKFVANDSDLEMGCQNNLQSLSFDSIKPFSHENVNFAQI